MNKFYTESNLKTQPHLMYCLSRKFGKSSLFNLDCCAMIWTYTLFDEKEHTLFSNKVEVIKYLVEQQGADIHAGNDWSLQIASRDGHFEIVKYLVEQGANIHALEEFPVRIGSVLDPPLFLIHHHPFRHHWS